MAQDLKLTMLAMASAYTKRLLSVVIEIPLKQAYLDTGIYSSWLLVPSF